MKERNVIFALLISTVCFWLLIAPRSEAADEQKTIEYFVGEITGETASGSAVNMTFTFFLGDTVATTQSAVFEITGTSAPAASQSIQVSVDDSTFATSRARTYELDTTGRENDFRILYDASSYISPTAKGDYTYTLNLNATGASVFVYSAKLFLTYRYTRYSSDGGTDCCIKTVKYFAGQETGETISGTQISMNHTFLVGDKLTTVQGAFYEITGVSLATGANTLSLSLSGGSGTCSKSYDLDTTGRANHFHLLYDVTSCVNVPAGQQSENIRTLNITPTGASVFVLSAELIFTYRFTPAVLAVGGFRAKAEIISSTFDTAIANGAAPNTLTWKGAEPAGTRVGFQFASSDAVGGPFTYLGPGGTSVIPGDMYEPAPDTPVEIKAAHHNKRYFRYKAILCSNTDCVTAGGSSTPRVDDVILNWSP